MGKIHLIATVLLSAAGRPSLAQQVDCRVTRQADRTYVGLCLRGVDTLISDLRLSAPRNINSALFRGTGRMLGRPLPMALDAQRGGSFRGNGWLALSSLERDSISIAFSFRQNAFVAPSPVDLQILETARAELSDSTRWMAGDDQTVWIAALAMAMPPGADLSSFWRALTAIASDSAIAAGRTLASSRICFDARRSLFCALYDASLVTGGDYSDDRPAMYAVRAAIQSQGTLQHPLQQFNNQPTTTLPRVQAVLDSAIVWTRAGKRCSIQRCS